MSSNTFFLLSSSWINSAKAKAELDARVSSLRSLKFIDSNESKFNEHFEAILKHMMPVETAKTLLQDLIRMVRTAGIKKVLKDWESWQNFVNLI